MEIDRLDQLQSAVWRQAVSGDLAAVDRALKVIQARAKLLGLEDMTVNNITNNTVVIAGSGDDYVAALRAYANTPAAIEE
jgi:hypothetical protein